jgi:hypothetical protein
MSPEELASLKTSTTRELLDRIAEYEPLFDEYFLSTEKASKDLKGESTKWDEQDHETEVTRLRAYAEDIKFCGEIVGERLGLRGEQMIQANDTPVTQIVIQDVEVTLARVKTKMDMGLTSIRTNLARVAKEKATLKAEMEEEARLNARRRRVADDAAAAPAQARQARFQASEGTRPEVVNIDCTFTQWDTTSYKLKAYMRSAVKPDVFTAQDQQILFMDFMDSAMQTQVRNKLIDKPMAEWEECIGIVEALMEIKHPLWNRREKAFSIIPNEGEPMTTFIARLKQAWAQAKVDSMSIEEIKMVHIVKLIPAQKLREDCTEILNAGNAKLDDIEAKIARSEQSKNLAEEINPSTQHDKSNATSNRNGPPRDKPKNDVICNRCNKLYHLARDCKSAKNLKCTDCKKEKHLNKFSGYCDWNTSNFTIPLNEQTENNPKIKAPQPKQDSTTTQYDKVAAIAFDRALQTLAQRQTNDAGGSVQYVPGNTVPAAPFITETDKWTQSDMDQFLQFKQMKQKAAGDQSRRTTFNAAVNSNNQDTFRILDTTRATFADKEEIQEVEDKSTEDRIREHTVLQQEREEKIRKEKKEENARKGQIKGDQLLRDFEQAGIRKLSPEWASTSWKCAQN